MSNVFEGSTASGLPAPRVPRLADFRSRYPQYADMPDAALADALHRKFYSDMPKVDFDAQIGLRPAQSAITAGDAPDLDRIKRNVAEMVDMGAPESDIDTYIAEEGTTVDAVRAFRSAPATPDTTEMSIDQQKALARMRMRLRTASDTPSPPASSSGAKPAGGGYGDRDVNGRTGSTALGVMDTLTFGFGDEIGAGINSTIDAGLHALTGREGKSYAQWHNKLQGLQENAQEQHPGYYLGGQVAGAIASPTTRARSALPVLAEGAASGAAYGAGSADGGLTDRLKGAAWGGVTGAGGAMLGRTVGNAVTKRFARDAIPTASVLEDASHALYDAADAANVVLRPATVNRMIGNAKLGTGRLDTNIRPQTAGIVAEFEDKASQPMTLRAFDDLRRSVNNVMKGASDEDLRTLNIIKTQMDSLADRMTPTDISGGLEGVQHLKDARQLWSMKSKSELVDGMVEKAKTTAAGRGSFEDSLRNEFKALAKNDKRMRTFTDAEQDAIMKVARGGPVVNTLRILGKFSPDSPLLAGAGALGALGASGGTAAIAVPLAGMGAKAAAGAITRGNVRALDEVIRSGGLTVGDIIEQGRRGIGPGVAAAERGGAVSDRLRMPLARNAALADEYRRR